MATATRIYYVNADGVERLVRAAHPSAALMHVARDYAVRVATQDDLVNCLIEGIKPENAKEEAQPEPEAQPAADKSLPLWPASMPVTDSAAAANAHAESHPMPADDEDDEDKAPPPRGLMFTKGKPAKYRDDLTGSTWSGRGLKPTWLRVALANGKSLSDFEVKTETAQA